MRKELNELIVYDYNDDNFLMIRNVFFKNKKHMKEHEVKK